VRRRDLPPGVRPVRAGRPPSSGRHSYTYAVPDSLSPQITPGTRVVVPVRNRKAIGLVTAVDVPAPDASAKPIAEVADQEPALSESLSPSPNGSRATTGHPWPRGSRHAPGALWTVGRPAGPRRPRRGASPRSASAESPGAGAGVRAGAQEAGGVRSVEALGGSAPVRHLVEQMGFSRAALDGLVKGGWARIHRVTEARDPFSGLSVPHRPS